MRRLTRTTTDPRRIGPVLEVAVEPVMVLQELMRRDGKPIPSVRGLALIDTGASNTVIRPSLSAGLGLEPVGTVFFHTASTTDPLDCLHYLIRLVFSGTVAFEVEVAEASMGGQAVQCLIGRDILQHVVLNYHGPKGHFTLTFPEQPEIEE